MADPAKFAPDEMEQSLLRLTLADPDQKLAAHQPITIDVDYSATEPAGVQLPLVLTVVSGSSPQSFVRQLFRLVRPSSITFTPKEGGTHLVRLGELHHNRWQGKLRLTVEGDRLREDTR